MHLATGGREADAMESADRALPIVEAAGHPMSIAMAYYSKGMAYARKDPEIAVAAYERAVGIARQCGNRLIEGLAIPEIATLQSRQGDPVAALRTFRQLLHARRGSLDLLFLASSLARLTILFARIGLPSVAATLHGAMSRVLESRRFLDGLSETIERVRSELGHATFDQASGHGAAMTLEVAIDYAQEQISLALASLDSSEG
jgi:tetratricopeptide (TPR) repeat protein